MGFFEPSRLALVYAFGHQVSSHHTDAHAGDSGDLATDVMKDLGLTEREVELVELLAEHVAFNYNYTGEGIALTRRIERGEV